MKKIAAFFFAIVSISFAVKIQGSYSTGFYMGTPFWNSDNYTDRNEIDIDDYFMRTLNQLRLNGRFGSHFKVRINALRNDGFQSDNHLSETKIYQAYGQFDWSAGQLKLGRFVPFNRWIWGSVDGGALSYSLTKAIKISAFGGSHMPYGLIYDSDNAVSVAYADFAIKFGKYRVKLKAFNTDDETKIGADFYGRSGGLRYSGNYGYNLTDGQLADGGLNILYFYNRKLNFTANYRLFRTMPWNLGHTDFQTYLIERFLAGAGYKLSQDFSFDLRQMVTLTSEQTDYLSYITLVHKYFTVGINYLSGSSGLERFGLILTGNYSPSKDFRISAGIAPVDYLYQNQDDHLLSIAYYAKLSYRVLDALGVRLNFHYFQDNPSLQSKYRGGLQINYFFGS